MQSPVLSPTPPNHTAQSPLLLDAPVSPSTIGQIVTNIPSRLDTLPFSFWHVRVILALGASWILDGVLVTNISLISAALRSPETLHLSDVQIGSLGTAYLVCCSNTVMHYLFCKCRLVPCVVRCCLVACPTVSAVVAFFLSPRRCIHWQWA